MTAADRILWADELAGRYKGDADIARQYAMGLVNLSCEQDAAGAARTVERLGELIGQYEGNTEIAPVYETGLEILRSKQP